MSISPYGEYMIEISRVEGVQQRIGVGVGASSVVEVLVVPWCCQEEGFYRLNPREIPKPSKQQSRSELYVDPTAKTKS
jgi:hypothetical protein